MAIVQTLRKACLGMLGAEDPSQADLPTLDRILSDINASIEIIGVKGPSWWTKKPFGTAIRPPTTLTGLTFTNYSNVITGAGFEDWMHGCTVQLTNQGHQNQLTKVGTAWELQLPWIGTTTAAGTMTVYHDCLTLPDRTFEVIAPLDIPTERRLMPLYSDADLYTYGGGDSNSDYGSAQYGAGFIRDRQIDTPYAYRVQSLANTAGFPRQYIRVHPLPPQSFMLRGWVRRLFPVITSLDDTIAEICPNGMDNSVLMPIVKWKFSGWELYDGNQKNVDTEYAAALELLNSIHTPQTEQLQEASNQGLY